MRAKTAFAHTRLAWLLAAAFATAPAAAQPRPTVIELHRSLAGEWSGALGYRDYQSDKLFELPVRTWVENVPDGATQVRRSIYDEGAGQSPVWIVSLLQFGKDGSLASAIMRAGREPEIIRESGALQRYDAPDRWVIVYSRKGTDDDKPSDIRITETRNGTELLSVKEVRPEGDPSAPWKFRNQVRLKQVPIRP